MVSVIFRNPNLLIIYSCHQSSSGGSFYAANVNKIAATIRNSNGYIKSTIKKSERREFSRSHTIKIRIKQGKVRRFILLLSSIISLTALSADMPFSFATSLIDLTKGRLRYKAIHYTMKIRILTAPLIVEAMAALMSFNAFADSWQSDANGWWWQNDNKTAECYYFDKEQSAQLVFKFTKKQ